MKVVLLAGGTGGALLAQGLDEILAAGDLTVVTNTADDEVFHGLLVCPDTDAVTYRLAGLFNEDAGWGVRDESFNVRSMLRRYGEEEWFELGDRDLATHLLRRDLMAAGATLTDATLELGRRLGLRSRVVPMSDTPVRAVFETGAGRRTFQEHFVRDRLQPPMRDVEFVGLDTAAPSPAATAALAAAEAVVIGPSNPVISIGPILGVLRDAVDATRTVAISPIVAGRSLKGPTAEMLRRVAGEASSAAVARLYRPRARAFVLDRRDSGLRRAIEALEYRVLVMDTLMRDGEGRRRVARAALEAVA